MLTRKIIIIIFFGHTAQHVESSLPDQGLTLCPLHWKHKVLSTGSWGSPCLTLLKHVFDSLISY